MASTISPQALSGLRCRQPAAVASRTQNRVVCRCELQRRHDSSIMQPEGVAQHAGQRVALAAAACALAALLAAPGAMAAEEAADIVPVYFGNGCFWGRQFDYVQAEKALGRDPASVSAVAGYAGGAVAPKAGKVCYYRGPSGSVYEELGHAEVVQVDLRGDSEAAKQQYAKFAETYFKQFRKTPFGMLRLDPQDAGPGYRNVIGLPGGIQSPLFEVLQAANVNGMRLLPGDGNTFSADGRPAEDDVINTVWVLDSDKLAFNRAEQYHQFHNGIGRPFPKTYTKELKQQMVQQGKIDETGCPEYYFF